MARRFDVVCIASSAGGVVAPIDGAGACCAYGAGCGDGDALRCWIDGAVWGSGDAGCMLGADPEVFGNPDE
jgi:hypothetical protein